MKEWINSFLQVKYTHFLHTVHIKSEMDSVYIVLTGNCYGNDTGSDDGCVPVFRSMESVEVYTKNLTEDYIVIKKHVPENVQTVFVLVASAPFGITTKCTNDDCVENRSRCCKSWPSPVLLFSLKESLEYIRQFSCDIEIYECPIKE